MTDRILNQILIEEGNILSNRFYCLCLYYLPLPHQGNDLDTGFGEVYISLEVSFYVSDDEE